MAPASPLIVDAAPRRNSSPQPSLPSLPPLSVSSAVDSTPMDPLLQRRGVPSDQSAIERCRTSNVTAIGASVPGVLSPDANCNALVASMPSTSTSLSSLPPPRSSASASSAERPREKVDYFMNNGQVDLKKMPRRLLLLHEYTTVEQFRRDAKRGEFALLTQLSFEEKIVRFGSPYAPIYVPLAPGETKEQYEARFVQWLWTICKTTLTQLQQDTKHIRERIMRLRFASRNGRRRLRSGATKRDRSSNHSLPPLPIKKVKHVCTDNDSLDACRACGCRRCLLVVMGHLAATITSLESKAKSLDCPTETTTETADVIAMNGKQDNALETDGVEQQLLEAYDAINEMIVMNENALDASAAEMEELAKTDAAEATLRRDEDQELKGIIDEEIERRRVALAVVVVYTYRHNVRALEAIVDPTQTADVVHVQKISHHKCAQLAVEIAEIRERLVDAEHERDETEAKLGRLVAQRWQAMLTVVRFDQRVRELIRTLLTRAKVR